MRQDQASEDPTPFDTEWSRKYDVAIRRTVLGYDELHTLSVSILAARTPDPARLLVVGAGTGEELNRLATRFPRATLTGVDPSTPMLDVARERLRAADQLDRIELVPGLVEDLPEDPSFDAATLLLVMHFLPDDGAKLTLLRDIAARLRPGAPLVVADLCGDPSSIAFQLLRDAWLQRQVAIGMERSEATDMLIKIEQIVQFMSESRTLELFGQAGFGNVVPYFQALLFRGWVATRIE